MKRTFAKKELVGELGMPGGWMSEAASVVIDTIVDTRRWSADHELIFRLAGQPDGEAWRVYYSIGLTEVQDERPWENEETVEATLVCQVSEVVTVWKPKPDAPAAVEPATKALYRFRLDCGRMGHLDGLFTATPSDVEAAIGKHVYFGEVLGKHSEIEAGLTTKHFTKVTDDAAFVTNFDDFECASGWNPLAVLADQE